MPSLSGLNKRRRGIAVTIAASVCLPLLLAADPTSLHGAAYQHLKNFMAELDGAGFDPVVSYGGPNKYRLKLATLKLKVDPKLKGLAQYDPDTNTVSFASNWDPRKIRVRKDNTNMGETIWHEVTHALEHHYGDNFTGEEAHKERHIDYMTYVARTALPNLERMERLAKNGAPVAKLKQAWENYLSEMDAAAELVTKRGYPPNLDEMGNWFGFQVDPEKIRNRYLTAKAFRGRKWDNLRQAVAPPAPKTWTGEWRQSSGPSPNASLPAVLNQTGSSVTGSWCFFESAEQRICGSLVGTFSSNGMTMTGTITGSMGNPQASETFIFTMADDWRIFSGTKTYNNGKGEQPWWGWRP